MILNVCTKLPSNSNYPHSRTQYICHSDLTDCFSKFCISRHPTSRVLSVSPKVRDYSNSSPENFNIELTQINWDIITLHCLDTHQDIDKMSSTFYNKFNRLCNVPLKIPAFWTQEKTIFKTMDHKRRQMINKK